MRKIFLINFILFLFVGRGFTQCGSSQVEIRIEITTDDYGEETYWTLSDLIGTVIMEGGQGGVYSGGKVYKDSICVPTDACFFFDLYDGYGDGIFVPGGFKLYVNESLVSNGINDFGSKVFEIINCPDPCKTTPNSLTDLQSHLKGTKTLTADELTTVRNTFIRFPSCLAKNDTTILLAKEIIKDFDDKIGPLFTTSKTRDGFSKNPAESPELDIERALVALQQGIFDHVFTAQGYTKHKEIIDTWKFNTCKNFPGDVDPTTNATVSKTVLIRANFEDPDGMNPYYDINFERMEHALRPTGMYLSPGTVATVIVPDSLVGKDYWIRVGSHDWDLTERPYFRRLDRISKRFAIDSTVVEVFNPLGGAISILVPYGANEGNVEVSVKNGVEAPFFSLKSFDTTEDFDAEMAKPGPWAIFETENVMYTIPKHSIVPGQYDIKQTLLNWETALRCFNSIVARQIMPDKHNMYMIADVDIRTGVYSIGYPMSNTPLDYKDVPGPAYFINGPGPDDEVNFHEAGHALRISKFPGEEEAFVNFPYVMALNYGLKEDLNEAVKYSFVPNTFDIDKTVAHRMVSNTFGTERDLSNTETDEVRYQHRGYGHYFEIVNILGWCALRNFWTQEFIDFQNGILYGDHQNIDKRIVRMSVAAKADLRPLFHVFGIVPQDSIKMQDTLVMLGIKPSLDIYNRLQKYFELIPKDNKAFVEYALAVYPNLYSDGPTDNPNYGVGWHYLKSLKYDEAEAKTRTDLLKGIIELYYPNGKPTDKGNQELCCILDTMKVTSVNDNIIVTGGVEPLEISIDTIGNIRTITVVDFDGCVSSIQNTIISSTAKDLSGIRIYPNPASTAIYIDMEKSNSSIINSKILSMSGQLISLYQKDNRSLDISMLQAGIYILQIELESGVKINKKILVQN